MGFYWFDRHSVDFFPGGLGSPFLAGAGVFFGQNEKKTPTGRIPELHTFTSEYLKDKPTK